MKATWAEALFITPGWPVPADSLMPIPADRPTQETFDFSSHVLGGRGSLSVLFVYRRWDSLVDEDLTAIIGYFRAAVNTINARALATQDVLTALIALMVVELETDDQGVANLLRQLHENKVGVRSFAEQEPTLEDVFMLVTKGLVT